MTQKKPLANSIKNPNKIQIQPNSTPWKILTPQSLLVPFTQNTETLFPDTAEPEPNLTRCCAFVARRCATGATTLRRVRREGLTIRPLAEPLVETYHNLRKSWSKLTFRGTPSCTVADFGWFCIMESCPHEFFCNKNELQFARHVFLWGEMVSINYQLRICEKIAGNVKTWISAEFPNLIHP